MICCCALNVYVVHSCHVKHKQETNPKLELGPCGFYKFDVHLMYPESLFKCLNDNSGLSELIYILLVITTTKSDGGGNTSSETIR